MDDRELEDRVRAFLAVESPRSAPVHLRMRVAEIQARADSAVRPSDAAPVAHASIVAGRPRRPWGRVGPGPLRPTLARSVVVLLLMALLASAGVLVGSQLLKTDPVNPPNLGKFTPAGSIPEARESGLTATGLPDGRVLVIGGCHPCAVAQLWDPTTSTFSPAGALPEGREDHSATLLPDGRVLVLGGYGGADWKTTPSGPTAAELWDARTLSFSSAGTHAGIAMQTATLLPDGRVLIGDEATFELWDPVDLSFRPAGTLLLDIADYTATGLPDGRVLIVGGFARFAGGVPSAIAEVWDPRTRSFSPTGSLAQARERHTATLLADGRVLIVGGYSWDSATGHTLASAEVWDPITEAFSPAGTLSESLYGHTATLLPDGRVLIAGGVSGQQTGPDGEWPDGEWRDLASAELWDSSTEAFDPAGSLAVARGGHAASLLPDGRVFMVGGGNQSDHLLASAEVWSP